LGVGVTILPCKKKIVEKTLKKFWMILWRRPRPKLGCGSKDRKKILRYNFITFLQEKRKTAKLLPLEHQTSEIRTGGVPNKI
jgi:hypothetical protein